MSKRDAWAVNWDYSPDDVDYLAKLNEQRDLIEQAMADRREAIKWRAEAEFWRKKYTDHINSSIRNSEALVGNVFKALIEKGSKA